MVRTEPLSCVEGPHEDSPRVLTERFIIPEGSGPEVYLRQGPVLDIAHNMVLARVSVDRATALVLMMSLKALI
jgi:hypothetical protein